MQFTKALRPKVASGEVTTSIRIWKSPRVKVGNRYRMEAGYVRVLAVHAIELGDITNTMVRESGFASRAELLKVAQHGRGQNVYLVEFEYETA